MRGWGFLILILLASFAIQHYLWNHQLLSSSTCFLGASSWICIGDTAILEVAIEKTNLLPLTAECDLHSLAFQIVRIRVSETLPTRSHTPPCPGPLPVCREQFLLSVLSVFWGLSHSLVCIVDVPYVLISSVYKALNSCTHLHSYINWHGMGQWKNFQWVSVKYEQIDFLSLPQFAKTVS